MSKHTDPSSIIPCVPPTHKRFKDLTGNKFNRLTVTGLAGKRPNIEGTHYYLWNCICECGRPAIATTNRLKSGQSKSCGCLDSEVSSLRMIKFNTTHGMCRSPGYSTWARMIARCYNQKHPAFENYGARGISVCDRWKMVENFLLDMWPRPSSKHSLDRINNNGNYEPSNCRWATDKEQQRNKRNNCLLTFNGETLCCATWAERLNIRPGVIVNRLRSGWSEERALTTPLKPHKVTP